MCPVCARMGCESKIVKKCKGETQKAYAWALAGMSGHGSVCSLANVLHALPKVHFCQRFGYGFVAE